MNDQYDKESSTSRKGSNRRLLLSILLVWIVIGGVIIWVFTEYSEADEPQADHGNGLTQADILNETQSEGYTNNSTANFKEPDIEGIDRSDEYMEAEVGTDQIRTSENKVPSYLEILSYKSELLALPDFREKQAFLRGLNDALIDGRLTNKEHESIKHLYFVSKEAYAKNILLSDVQHKL